MMRLSFSTIACPSYSVGQVLAAARRYGYDGVELYALEGERLTPHTLERHHTALQQACKTSAVPIVCLNSWAHLASLDQTELAAQEAQISRAFELAEDLGCPLVKAFGGELPPGVPHARVYDQVAGTVTRLCEKAGQHGVRLVLETHDGFSAGRSVAQVLQRVDHPAFAALWDVFHTYRVGESIEQTDAQIGDRVSHVHVKDAVRLDDGWRFVLLGEGELPIRALIGRLARRGYAGYISVDWEKMWRPELADPEIALPHFARLLRQYGVDAQKKDDLPSHPPSS